MNIFLYMESIPHILSQPVSQYLFLFQDRTLIRLLTQTNHAQKPNQLLKILKIQKSFFNHGQFHLVPSYFLFP